MSRLIISSLTRLFQRVIFWICFYWYVFIRCIHGVCYHPGKRIIFFI